MPGSAIGDVAYRVGNAVFGAVLVLLPVTLLIDLTLAHGQIPNEILIGGWFGVLIWAFITEGRAEQERLERLTREEARTHGLVRVPDDTPLPVGFPLFPSDERPVNLARAAIDGRDVFVVDVDAAEDDQEGVDERRTRSFTVCFVNLPGSLPRFHVELGSGLARFRAPWPQPEVILPGVGYCDPLPPLLDAWFHYPKTTEFMKRLPSPSQIRVDGRWLAMFVEGTRDRTPLLHATLALCERVPRSLYAREE